MGKMAFWLTALTEFAVWLMGSGKVLAMPRTSTVRYSRPALNIVGRQHNGVVQKLYNFVHPR